MPVRAYHVYLKVRQNNSNTYDRGNVYRKKIEAQDSMKKGSLFPKINASKTPQIGHSSPKRDIRLRSDHDSPNHKPTAASVGLSDGVSSDAALFIPETDRFKTIHRNYGSKSREGYLPSQLEV